MAKRRTGVGKNKTSRSHKTKKRLVINKARKKAIVEKNKNKR